MATTTVTNKSISAGNQTLDAIAASVNDFLTMQVVYTGIDKDVKVKLQQTLDDINYCDIEFPGGKEMSMIIRGTGSKAINLVGLHASKVRAQIVVQDATAGTISKLVIYN